VNEAFLVLKDVSKRFGNVQALNGVQLELGGDELLVVLGPTGAGKTTLLRTIVGLETPDAGTVEIEGRDIVGLSPSARDVALVFQNFSLYPDWTVRRNMEFPLKAPGRKTSPGETRERVEWAASLLGISRLLNRRAATLSGGEMQRVTIGRAIVRRPKLFLMDEPLSNLDAKLREALRVELAVLRRELKTPMIFVTHDQAEALSMGDRIVVLSEGEILQTGVPDDVYRRPVSPVVARQLGQPAINVVPVNRSEGHWVAEDGSRIARAEGGRQSALLGIRPEDVQTEGGERPATVQVVEDTGPEKILLVEWAGTSVRVIVPRTADTNPGDQVFPRVEPGKVVVWERD